MSAARRVSESQVVMTEIVLPSHTNALGSIFGGVVMSWIDIAAAIAAQRHSRKIVVTASIDSLHFFEPIYLGWIVNLYASVNYVSKHSMEVGVKVEAENPQAGKRLHTASAYLTFVAIDNERKAVEVPGLVCETDQERRRFSEGQKRREARLRGRELAAKKI